MQSAGQADQLARQVDRRDELLERYLAVRLRDRYGDADLRKEWLNTDARVRLQEHRNVVQVRRAADHTDHLAVFLEERRKQS